MALFYDIAANAQQIDPMGAYAQGLQVRNALSELKRQQAQDAKDEEIRNGLMQFYRPAVGATNGVEVNSPEALRVGQPGQAAGYDYQGAADYLAGHARFEQGEALAKLRKQFEPQLSEWTGVLKEAEDDQGNPVLLGMTNQGPRPVAGYRPKPEVPKLDVKGGFITKGDQIVAPMPMTPQQKTQLGMDQERLRLAQESSAREAQKAQAEADAAAKKKQQDKAAKYKSVDELDSTLAAYKTQLETASRADLANPLSDKAIRLGNLATQLQMAYKTAAELGAITGPDWKIINSIVATPSGAKAALMGPKKLLTQLDEVRALSQRQRQQLDQAFGGGLSAVPPVNARGWKLHVDANGNRAYVSQDGKQFEEVRNGL